MSTEKQRITEAASKELPQYVQNLIWYTLEQRETQGELNRFDLDAVTEENGKALQSIVHTYKREYLYPVKLPIETSVIVKTDASGAMLMMLTNECKNPPQAN